MADTGGFERIGPVNTGGFERVGQSKPDDSYTMSILPFRKDAQGFHLAVPEIIAGPVRGAAEMGKRALGEGEAGKNPLRPLSHDSLSAVMALGGTRLGGMADLGMLGPSTLAPGGALASERLAAMHPLEQGAAAVKAGSEALSNAIVNRSPEAAEKFIQNAYTRAVKPSVAGKATSSQLDRYNEQARGAISSIVENKANLKFADDVGETTGQLPKTLEQFADAIEQTKQSIFEKYDAMAQRAGNQGVKVDLRPAVNELDRIANDQVVKDLHPELAAYAAKRAEVLAGRGAYSATDAQRAIQNLNTSLKAFYRSPSYETAGRANVDAMVANQLRSGLDRAIESAVAPGYQELKNQYGALTAIEKDVVHRAIVEGRKNAGGGLMGNFGDIISAEEAIRGIMTMNPKAIATGAALKGLTAYVRYLRDPNRAVTKIFETAEKHAPKREPQTQPWDTGPMQPPRPTGPGMPPMSAGAPRPPGGTSEDMGLAPRRPFVPLDPFGNTVVPGGGASGP